MSPESASLAYLKVLGQKAVEKMHVGSSEVCEVLELLNGSLLHFEQLKAWLLSMTVSFCLCNFFSYIAWPGCRMTQRPGE